MYCEIILVGDTTGPNLDRDRDRKSKGKAHRVVIQSSRLGMRARFLPPLSYVTMDNLFSLSGFRFVFTWKMFHIFINLTIIYQYTEFFEKL